MIYNVLNKVQEYLKTYFAEVKNQRDAVKISALSKDGEDDPSGVVMTLLHIEEESSLKPQSVYVGRGEKDYKNPALLLNLYVLFSAQDKDYGTALKNISTVIEAFQANSVINSGSADKKDFVISMHQMNLEHNMNMWQSIGSKLMPSVVYKVRMLEVQVSGRNEDSVQVDTVAVAYRQKTKPENLDKSKPTGDVTYTKADASGKLENMPKGNKAGITFSDPKYAVIDEEGNLASAGAKTMPAKSKK